VQLNETDIIPFTRYVEGFVKLIQREVQLMKLILPEEYHNQVIDQIVSTTVNEISNESSIFVKHLRDSTARNRITYLSRKIIPGEITVV